MLGDTLEALRAVALASVDASGHFPAMYARVTQRVIEKAARREFDDDGRMTRFVDCFAGRYLAARSSPSSAAGCWQAGFAVAADEQMLIVQHLLLGINAHVNYDLPLTVVELAGGGGIDGAATAGGGGADLAALRPDFDAVNAVLAETYHDLLRDLDRVTRWVGRAAAAGGGHLFNFSLHAARDQAWRTAVGLHSGDPATRSDDIGELDELASALAGLVKRPTMPFRWLVPLARRLETRDPVVVTRRLLGPLA